jgi:hypothetical protein
MGGGRAHFLSEIMRTPLKEAVKNDPAIPAVYRRGRLPRQRASSGGGRRESFEAVEDLRLRGAVYAISRSAESIALV